MYSYNNKIFFILQLVSFALLFQLYSACQGNNDIGCDNGSNQCCDKLHCTRTVDPNSKLPRYQCRAKCSTLGAKCRTDTDGCCFGYSCQNGQCHTCKPLKAECDLGQCCLGHCEFPADPNAKGICKF